jgi:hypothetical protein
MLVMGLSKMNRRMKMHSCGP